MLTRMKSLKDKLYGNQVKSLKEEVKSDKKLEKAITDTKVELKLKDKKAK